MGSHYETSRPIVGMKITPPSKTAQLIMRPRLNSWMREATLNPFTFLVAPAGYGKTSTVVCWSSTSRNCSLGWLTLEAEENSLDRFWTYLDAALRDALPRADLPTVSGSAFSSRASLLAYVDELVCSLARQEDEAVLVIEDIHAVTDEEVMESFSYFMLHVSGGIRFVVTSRRQPTFKGYTKLKADGVLRELNAPDLRFSAAEVKEMFSRKGQPLRDGDAQRIVEITTGWPIAVKFLIMSTAMPKGGAGVADLSLSVDLICDYCTQELLADLPANVRAFLLKSVVVNPFCRSLAYAAFGLEDESVARSIQYLMNGSFFISETVDRYHVAWYRYHDLFAEAIKKIAARELEDYEEVERRASMWYEEQGMLEKSVEAAGSAQGFDIIERVIVQNWRTYHREERLPMLAHWLSYLPEQRVLASMELCVVGMLTTGIRGDEEASELLWQAVKEGLCHRDPLFAEALVVRSIVAFMAGKYEECERCASAAMDRSEELGYFLRGIAQLDLGTVCRAWDMSASLQLLERARDELPPLGNTSLTCLAYTSLVSLECDLGRFANSRYYLEKAFDLYPPLRGKQHPPMFITAFPACAMMAYRQGRLEEAQSFVSVFFAESDENRVIPHEAATLACAAQIARRRGLDDEAHRLIGRAFALSKENMSRAQPSVCDMLKWMEEGAFGPDETVDELFPADHPLASVKRLGWIVRFLHGDTSWRRELEAVLRTIDPDQRLDRLELHLLDAIAKERCGLFGEAEQALAEAVDLAADERMGQLFLDDIEMIAPILDRVKTDERFCWVLDFARQSQGVREEAGGSDCSRRLTAREHEVMGFVAEGRDTTEIALAMRVSIQTVRKHLSNVYTKLGAHSRTQALALYKRGASLR